MSNPDKDFKYDPGMHDDTQTPWFAKPQTVDVIDRALKHADENAGKKPRRRIVLPLFLRPVRNAIFTLIRRPMIRN